MYITALFNMSAQNKKNIYIVSVCNNCIIKLDAAAVQFIVQTLKIMIMKAKESKTLSNNFNEKYILLLKEATPCAPNHGPM